MLQNTKSQLNKSICGFAFSAFCSLQRRNVWEKLPTIMWLRPELQRASFLPTRPLRLLLRQRLVWHALWDTYVWKISSSFLCVCHLAHHRFLFLLSACPNDMYGPDCKLSCKCQNGGVCKRFTGCTCPTGWRGQNCEKSGRFDMNALFPTTSIHHDIAAALEEPPELLNSVLLALVFRLGTPDPRIGRKFGVESQFQP